MVWGVSFHRMQKILFFSKHRTFPLHSGQSPAPLSCASGWRWQSLRHQHLLLVVYVLDAVTVSHLPQRTLALLLDLLACFSTVPQLFVVDSWL
jgi:hypothetical protein